MTIGPWYSEQLGNSIYVGNKSGLSCGLWDIVHIADLEAVTDRAQQKRVNDARFIAQARTLTPVLLDDTIELLEAMLEIAKYAPFGAGLDAKAVLRSTVTRWETANLIPK